ncbi:MAG: SPFH domain-containing protein [Cyanobacteriota bacterium]|nr:SPFH domain-containing protein [Cyanobacteriota bacterium]
MGYLLGILLVGIAAYAANTSVIIISENDRAIVERTGTYHRTLESGIRFVLPFVEKVVYVDTLRERFLDIEPQEVITQDGLTLLVDAVVYWKILDIQKAYYEIENIEEAFVSIVLTSMRSEITGLKAKDTSSSKKDLDKALLKQLDETTSNWGVKVIRVEIQNIIFPKRIQAAMENEWAALSEKEARIAIAEAEKTAEIAKAEAEKATAIANAQADAETIRLLAESLHLDSRSPDFLNYLVAIRYVEANEKLGESANSKILFVDPSTMSYSVQRLLGKGANLPEFENEESDGNGNGKKPLL